MSKKTVVSRELDSCRPPLGEPLLRKYSFFELYPLDGGAFFITRELFGTLDDAAITRQIVAEDGLADFGGLAGLDFRRFERWRTIEKSCWLNRFYFIVPMARQAWLTGDRALANRVKAVMLRFHRECPPPRGGGALEAHWKRVVERMERDYNSRSYEVYSRDETDVEYIWFDMQPGVRLLTFLYAAFFIREVADFPEAELMELRECLRLHARVIAAQEGFQKPYLDNHQSLRAVALLHAVPLLCDEPDYAAVRQLALALCEWHVTHEFLDNGVLFENSPSYHAFVLWHARDYLVLARRLGGSPGAEAVRKTAAAAAVLAGYRRSDGLTLTVNDSYQFDATALLESLDQTGPAPDYAVLKPGGLAVGRNGDGYAALDVSDFTGKFSHYHGGKNAPVVLWRKKAFLEDPGCPNYDLPQFPLCKQSAWHSSLLVDGEGDTHAFGLYGFDAWATLVCDDAWHEAGNGKSFTATLTSNASGWRDVVWRRRITLRPDGVDLDDTIEGGGKVHDYTLLFTLAPEVSVDRRGAEWLLQNGECRGILTLHGDAGDAARIVGVENCQSRNCRPARQIAFDFRQRQSVRCRVSIRFPDGGAMR